MLVIENDENKWVQVQRYNVHCNRIKSNIFNACYKVTVVISDEWEIGAKIGIVHLLIAHVMYERSTLY